jgi:membrane protease YdiL (CAAX protease family)
LFFCVAYALSWSIQIPLALQSHGKLSTSLPYSLHYLSAFGPLASAFITAALTEGRTGIRSLIRRMTKWRISIGWWLVAFSPLFLYMLTAIIVSFLTATAPAGQALGKIDFMPDLAWAALPFWILTFGIGEETGWRGFALPRLQRNHSALRATLTLWILWTLWHLPLFFYSYEASILPGLAIGLLAGTITFTWLYNSTGGSILILAIWHGSFNFVTACSVCKTGISSAVVSTMVMIWALLIVVIYKPARLSNAEKQVD